LGKFNLGDNITHIICLVHTRDDKFEVIKKHINSLRYKLKTGAKYEIGNFANPKVAELRFIDVIVKDDYKERFLADLKECNDWVHADKEPIHFGDCNLNQLAHGVDGKGFPLKRLRSLINWALKFLNCKAIDMAKITQSKGGELNILRNKEPWKGYVMAIGELPAGKEATGRENT